MNKKIEEHVTDSRNSLDDMLQGKSQALSGAINDFKNNVSSFEEAVAQFWNTATKSPEEAKNLILAWIDKVDKNKLSEAEKTQLSKFRSEVDGAGNREQLKSVLESPRHATIVTKLEWDSMKWLNRLAGHLWATTPSGSNSPTIGQASKTVDGNFTMGGSSRMKIPSTWAVTDMSLSEAEKIVPEANGDTLNDAAVKKLFGVEPSTMSPGQRTEIVKAARAKL